MEIRGCTQDDLELLMTAWPTPGDVAAAHFAEQQATGANFLVAWDTDIPLGWAVVRWDGCVGRAARAAYPNCVEVIHLQVRESVRSRGVGSALLAEAERLARERGVDRIAVSVGLDNPHATRLYDRLGFEATTVVDTIEYTWVDDTGQQRAATESNELRVKHLRGA